MTENANKPDIGSILDNLELLQDFVDNFKTIINEPDGDAREDQLYQLAINFSGIDIGKLITELSGINHDLATSKDSSRVEEQFAELKAELESKDQKIQEFKLSLADTVIESKGLQKRSGEQQETIVKLRNEISQMQLHTKDLSLKLATAEKNFQATQTALASANEELLELRERSYALKGRSADLEDQIREFDRQILELTRSNGEKDKEIDRLSKLSERLDESFKLTRTERNALEERSSELETTIENLQREKSALQSRLDKLLTGLPKSVSYSNPRPSEVENSLLEPRHFLPYLPFCFPERVPHVIGFRREVKQSFGKTFPKDIPPPAPAFPHNFKIKFSGGNIRSFAFKPTFDCSITEEFPQELAQPEPNAKIFARLADFSRKPKDISLELLERELEASLKRPQRILLRSSSLKPMRRIEMLDNPEFGIHTHSLDLLLSFLTRTIIEGNYRELRHAEPLIAGSANFVNKDSAIKTANIFNEKLAFRYGYQLKSHKLNLHRVNFAQSFRRGAGLRSVLETFGNTINSMVQKYDVFSSPKLEKTTKK